MSNKRKKVKSIQNKNILPKMNILMSNEAIDEKGNLDFPL